MRTVATRRLRGVAGRRLHTWTPLARPARAAGVEGSPGAHLAPTQHVPTARAPGEAAPNGAPRHVPRAAAVSGRLSSSSEASGSSSGGTPDFGAMFLERISSNGATSSSSSGAAGAAAPAAAPQQRRSRHERTLLRRAEQRAGRRGGAGGGGADANNSSSGGGGAFPGQPELHEEEQEEFDLDAAAAGGAGFAGAWGAGAARRGQRQTHAPTPRPSAQDAFLDAFIDRLLSPQHGWDDRPLGAPVLAPPPPETREGRDALTPAALESVPRMDPGAGALLFSDLARAGKLLAALQLLEAALSAGRSDLVARVSHRNFFAAAAGLPGVKRAVLRFLQLLPAELADARTYTLALRAAAATGDVETATSVVSVMGVRGVPLDVVHRTTLVAGAARAVNLGAAFRHYAEALAAAAAEAAAEREAAAAPGGAAAGAAPAPRGRGRAGGATGARLDGWVYGALIAACAAGIKAAANDRKEQLVLLERAFGVLDDAAAAKVHLDAPAWNALLMCCGEGPGG